ncbi:MAG: EamA family transporter [Butyrivibrio sp.]|nr:EamA family transporter [Butyrivibrio sp.]
MFLKKTSIYVILLFAVFFSSFSSVLSKMASKYDVPSWQFFLLYGAALSVLVIYSIIWQLCLEQISLTKAYMLRGVLFIFVTMWSVFIFGEDISKIQFIGVLLIALGVGVSQIETK